MFLRYLLLLHIIYHAHGSSLQDVDRTETRIQLNDGNSIPALGLGTFLGFDEKGLKKPQEDEVTKAVEWALEAGYRLIDTASAYQDEDQVGRGVKNSIEKKIVAREDVFITTKLGFKDHRRVVEALKESLHRLGMDYVDLYLIHFPTALTVDNKFDAVDYLQTWKAMEEAKKLGLARSIGVSNFNISQIQRVIDNSELKPAVLQVEVNLNFAQDELLKYARDSGIVVMAYTPFGSLFASRTEVESPPPPAVKDPVLVEMANKYNKTTPQIVLRYLKQRGVVPIPKSVTKARIQQNLNIFDFDLNEVEMEKLSKFNNNHRIVWPTFLQEHPYFPFEKSEVPGKNLFNP